MMPSLFFRSLILWWWWRLSVQKTRLPRIEFVLSAVLWTLRRFERFVCEARKKDNMCLPLDIVTLTAPAVAIQVKRPSKELSKKCLWLCSYKYIKRNKWRFLQHQTSVHAVTVYTQACAPVPAEWSKLLIEWDHKPYTMGADRSVEASVDTCHYTAVWSGWIYGIAIVMDHSSLMWSNEAVVAHLSLCAGNCLMYQNYLHSYTTTPYPEAHNQLFAASKEKRT